MSKRVTMQQIADYLGVSKFVVSVALAGKKGVSEETKEKVIKAASRLGYYINQAPQEFSEAPTKQDMVITEKKRSVLVVVSTDHLKTGSYSYWKRIIDGISDECEKLNMGMIILTDHSVDSLLQVLNLSGFIGLIGVGDVSKPLLLEAYRFDIPIVLVDNEEALIASDSIFANNNECTYRLTNYLIGIGHRMIGFVGNIYYTSSFYERWIGFRRAMEGNSLPFTDDYLNLYSNNEDSAGFDISAVKDWFIRLKNANKQPTALVCANDDIAFSVIKLLQEMGIQVPNDISVTGFDCLMDENEIAPSLTTVDIDMNYLGKRSVETLCWRLQNKKYPPERILVSGKMIIQNSTAAP